MTQQPPEQQRPNQVDMLQKNNRRDASSAHDTSSGFDPLDEAGYSLLTLSLNPATTDIIFNGQERQKTTTDMIAAERDALLAAISADMQRFEDVEFRNVPDAHKYLVSRMTVPLVATLNKLQRYFSALPTARNDEPNADAQNPSQTENLLLSTLNELGVIYQVLPADDQDQPILFEPAQLSGEVAFSQRLYLNPVTAYGFLALEALVNHREERVDDLSVTREEITQLVQNPLEMLKASYDRLLSEIRSITANPTMPEAEKLTQLSALLSNHALLRIEPHKLETALEKTVVLPSSTEKNQTPKGSKQIILGALIGHAQEQPQSSEGIILGRLLPSPKSKDIKPKQQTQSKPPEKRISAPEFRYSQEVRQKIEVFAKAAAGVLLSLIQELPPGSTIQLIDRHPTKKLVIKVPVHTGAEVRVALRSKAAEVTATLSEKVFTTLNTFMVATLKNPEYLKLRGLHVPALFITELLAEIQTQLKLLQNSENGAPSVDLNISELNLNSILTNSFYSCILSNSGPPEEIFGMNFRTINTQS